MDDKSVRLGTNKVYIIKWPVSVAYLSSVLSAREMAGFLTALLHAWLLLQTQKQ